MVDALESTIGTVRTYPCVEAWLLDAEDKPGMLHVGIVDRVGLGSGSDLGLFDALMPEESWVSGDFVLVTLEGKILAWQIRDESGGPDIAESDFTSREPRGEAGYRSAVRDLVRRRLGQALVWRQRVYGCTPYARNIQIVLPDLSVINDRSVAYLAEHPEALHSHLKPRQFEELLEKLFQDQGYETHLGPGTGDGGVDLRLLRRSDIGDLLVLVQAKRYAPEYPIKLQPVQALYGAVMEEDANKGILVTTSEFQPAAKKFAEKHSYRIHLADIHEIKTWLRQYTGK
ncbi:MAG TPA: restriction endonuclease [Phycisphaerae bacterium]|nr:restriction endonuclease [Phycisphaerae bacterium]